jgi:hypothetical protein
MRSACRPNGDTRDDDQGSYRDQPHEAGSPGPAEPRPLFR